MISRSEVKYIQSLYYKKNSTAAEVFIAEGVKILDELLHSDFIIQKIYALESWIQQNNNVKNVIEISETELNSITNFDTPNKVLAVVYKKNITHLPDIKNKITLMLDGIQDPGNLGTIIRTADWFGIENIIASNNTADLYNSKVIQTTMGSFTRVNIFYADLEAFLSANKIEVFGAAINGEDVNKLQHVDECILVVGNESKGIGDNILPYVKQKISIPRFGKAESLNAAVATGIILWKLKM